MIPQLLRRLIGERFEGNRLADGHPHRFGIQVKGSFVKIRSRDITNRPIERTVKETQKKIDPTVHNINDRSVLVNNT